MDTGARGTTILFTVIMALGILLCLWAITTGSPTAREALLYSLILTVLSIIGSWVTSQYFSASSYNKNLRVFALKAAEKVTNLSNELERVSAYLQQGLKDEYDSAPEAVLAKNMRFEAAVHIINTLKSVNDRSLSDWQGIIGDEITAQREEQEEREEMLRELLERVDSLQTAPFAEEQSHQEVERLLTELAGIKSDLRFMGARITGMPVTPPALSRKRVEVEKRCPNCSQSLQYTQKKKANNVKPLDCTHCGAKLISRETNGEFVVSVRVPVREEITCPACGRVLAINLGPLRGNTEEVQCAGCQAHLRAVRASNGVRARVINQSRPSAASTPASPLSEDLLTKISDAMGVQPWPKGQARKVSQLLSIDARLVARAIQELINRGVFLHQINGVLYAPSTTQSAASGQDNVSTSAQDKPSQASAQSTSGTRL